MLNEEISLPAISDKEEIDENGIKQKSDVSVKAENVDSSWDINSTDPTLRNINMELKKGQLVGVIGSVGSGKVT